MILKDIDLDLVPLTKNERHVVDECVIDGKTLVSVAKEIGLSVSRVRQIRNKALRRIAWYFENPERIMSNMKRDMDTALQAALRANP